MLVFWFWPILWILQMLRMSSSRILSRRVSPIMRLKVLKRYESLPLLLHLLIGSCPVFYACSSILLIQLSQRFGGHSDSFVFDFSFYAIFADYSVCVLSPCWSSDSGSCLTTSRISQMLRLSSSWILSRRVLPVMHLKMQLNLCI